MKVLHEAMNVSVRLPQDCELKDFLVIPRDLVD